MKAEPILDAIDGLVVVLAKHKARVTPDDRESIERTLRALRRMKREGLT